MSEQDGSTTIRKWERKIEKARDADEKATKDMKKVLAAAMRDEGTKRNIISEMKGAAQSGTSLKSREGYGDDGEVITGYADSRPWERE